VTPVGLVVLGAGVVLLWSGAKGFDVREVIKGAFTGNKPTKAGATHDEQVAAQPHPSASSGPAVPSKAETGKVTLGPGTNPNGKQPGQGGPTLDAGTANSPHPYIKNA
jgi:hypothetical protein